jgi:hypothetical protein
VAWQQRGGARAPCATRWCAMTRRDCRSCWERRRPPRAARRRRRASTCRWSRPAPRAARSRARASLPSRDALRGGLSAVRCSPQRPLFRPAPVPPPTHSSFSRTHPSLFVRTNAQACERGATALQVACREGRSAAVAALLAAGAPHSMPDFFGAPGGPPQPPEQSWKTFFTIISTPSSEPTPSQDTAGLSARARRAQA